jgi:peptidoglycan/LPS O-acetylase OafA/YrhL
MLEAERPASDRYAQFRARRFFSSLDGLRCLSILAVIWHHTRPANLDRYACLQRGFLGVDLFFVISGFLITTLLLREREEQGTLSLRRFYIRRTLRIFPLYFTALLVYTLVVALFDRNSPAGHAFFANLPAFATYTSNWFVSYSGSRVIFYFAWSLAAEEQFYLVWPTIEKHLDPRGATLFMIGLIMFVTATSAGLFESILPAGTLRFRIVTSFPIAIGLGVLLAHLLNERRGYRWASRLLGHRISAPIVLAVLSWGLARSSLSLWLVRGAMAALVGSTVIREDHWLAPLLTWRPVAYLGVISYGMYMLHMLASNFGRRALGHLAIVAPLSPFVVTVGLAASLASISFRYYESYFRALKDRLSVDRSISPRAVAL